MLEAFADGALFGERSGTGSPWLLALHGWGRSHADFARVIAPPESSASEAPGEVLDAVALDLPGFGATPSPSEASGSAWYADAVAPVLEEFPEGAVVLAHSFGGRVALHLASRWPGRIRAICLTGVPQLVRLQAPAAPSPSYRAWRFARRLGLVSEARLERARQLYGSRDYRETQGVMREVLVRVLAERYDDLLAEARMPVVFVWGERDTAAPVEEALAAAKLVRDGRVSVLEGVGHMTPLEAPGALRSAVLELRP